jgi:diguanylate cyclase (GGDEF)-like protein
MDEVGRRAARLLEETQAGKAEEVLRHVETVLREPTGDLAGGPAPMHFVRVVSLIMLDQVRACLEATELMLRAAERDGSVGWRACALATRASEGLRLGDLDIAEHDVDAALRDLIAAEALLALGDGDRIASVNARVGVGMGYRMLRLYELAGPQYQAAYELSAADGSGEGNAAMWLTNLAQLHLEWALELYQVNDVAGAEAHTARAEAYAMRAAVEAAGPDAGTWRAQALLAAACSRADRDEPAGAAVDIAHHLKVLETGGISAREVAYAQPFHAVALKRSGRPEEALRVMAAAVDNLPPDAEWLAAAATRRTYAVLLAAQGSTDAQAALAYGDTLAGALWRQRLRTLQTAETLKSYESLRIRHEEAARAAETDPLTGTANRRGFDREVNRLRTDAESAGRAATVLIIDMDKLKMINDTRGHRAGDEAVRAVAEVLRANTRDVDTVARLGGDEFGVVLPGARWATGAAIAERIVEAIRDIPDCLATVSIGVASGPHHALAETICRADEAMYVAKRSGGDAVSGATRSAGQAALLADR